MQVLRTLAPSFAFALALAIAPPVARAADPIPLEAGKPLEGSVSSDAEKEASCRTYRFTVPPEAVLARIEVEGRADVNLYVARHAMETHDPPLLPCGCDHAGKEKRPDLSSAAEGEGTEKVTIWRDSGEPARRLAPGEWFADVVYERGQPPTRADGTPIEAVAFRIALTIVRTRVDGKLEAGKPVAGSVDPSDGGFRTYTVEVPAGAKALRIDLIGAAQDLNIRARHGQPMLGDDDAEASAMTGIATEVLVVKGDDLEAGTWYVDVVDPHALEFSTAFTVRASLQAEADPSLLALPKLPAPKTPFDRALYATVELVGEEGGGSGVLVSEKGYILTNYHVVQDKVESHGMVGEPLAVGLTLDPRDPPRELFRARVVTSSAELDLALLKVVTGIYGQPIPADFKFPTAVLGTPERLTVGDPLNVMGYPAAGGTGSRVSVTFTRGIVSGFERRGATLHMKTDAMINSGNSGGAALDDKLQLVGFPTEVVPDAEKSGQIGYVRPLWLVPAEWWAKAGVAPPKKGP